MANKEKSIISDMMVEKVMKTISEISEEAMNRNHELEFKKFEYEKQKENRYKDEEELIKKEFRRICRELEAAKPGTDEYDKLLSNMYGLKRCFGNVY